MVDDRDRYINALRVMDGLDIPRARFTRLIPDAEIFRGLSPDEIQEIDRHPVVYWAMKQGKVKYDLPLLGEKYG